MSETDEGATGSARRPSAAVKHGNAPRRTNTKALHRGQVIKLRGTKTTTVCSMRTSDM